MFSLLILRTLVSLGGNEGQYKMPVLKSVLPAEYKINTELVSLIYGQLRKLLDLEERLTLLLISRGEIDMSPEVAEILKAMDGATTRIAARIQRLIDKSGLSADEKAAFAAEIESLNKLATDPTEPIPPGV